MPMQRFKLISSCDQPAPKMSPHQRSHLSTRDDHAIYKIYRNKRLPSQVPLWPS